MIKFSFLNKKGFTLFEIILAVMIFGIIALTLFSAFRSFIKSSYMVKDRITASEAVSSISNIMTMDFTSLRIALKPEYSINKSLNFQISDRGDKDKFRFFGDETTVEGDIFSRVRFASLAHIPFGSDYIKESQLSNLSNKTKTAGAAKPAGVSQIIYYVRLNEEDGFDLCRSDTLNQFEDTEGTICDPVICKNITKFKAAYIDIKGGEHTEWDSESDVFGYATPLSVKIDIDFKVEDSLHTFLTSISMPVFRKPVNSNLD